MAYINQHGARNRGLDALYRHPVEQRAFGNLYPAGPRPNVRYSTSNSSSRTYNYSRSSTNRSSTIKENFCTVCDYKMYKETTRGEELIESADYCCAFLSCCDCCECVCCEKVYRKQSDYSCICIPPDNKDRNLCLTSGIHCLRGILCVTVIPLYIIIFILYLRLHGEKKETGSIVEINYTKTWLHLLLIPIIPFSALCICGIMEMVAWENDKSYVIKELEKWRKKRRRDLEAQDQSTEESESSYSSSSSSSTSDKLSSSSNRPRLPSYNNLSFSNESSLISYESSSTSGAPPSYADVTRRSNHSSA